MMVVVASLPIAGSYPSCIGHVASDYQQKGGTMQQVMLGFVKEEPEVVALEPEVEKPVVTLMAWMIADLIQKQEGSRNEEQTDQ
jgi:hypothetical protein